MEKESLKDEKLDEVSGGVAVGSGQCRACGYESVFVGMTAAAQVCPKCGEEEFKPGVIVFNR